MDQVAKDADALFGGNLDTGLIIDETSFPKSGKKSVAVNRQWCGTLGKVDNCQVGVFTSLVRGSLAALVDGRLYVPKDWTDDSDRCRNAGIPKDIAFKSKSQLALDSVQHLRSLGIRFSWVGIDGGYGKEPHFLSTLDDRANFLLPMFTKTSRSTWKTPPRTFRSVRLTRDEHPHDARQILQRLRFRIVGDLKFSITRCISNISSRALNGFDT